MMSNSTVSSTDTLSGRRRAARQLAAFLVCFYVAWTLRATTLFVIDESITSPLGKAAYSSAIKFLLWVVPAAVFARWLRRAQPIAYLGLRPIPTRRTWWPCLLGTGGFLATVAGMEWGLRGHSIDWTRLSYESPLATGVSLVATPLIEEILFRGLVQREFMSLTTWPRANLITSTLFVGIHLPHWLWRDGMTGAVAINAGGVFVFSLLAGWLYVRSRSIWPPALAHMANNTLAMLLHG